MGNRADSDGAAPAAHGGDGRADTEALSQALSVLQSFHEAFVADRAAGKVRPVADYVALFPGFEGIVREQYRALREDDPPVRVPSTPGPVLARILGAGLRNLTPTQEVARGGMGVVYRVRDEVLHRDLAMKVLLDDSARIHVEGGAGADPTLHAGTALRRMVQEAQITAQLSHPGIVPVHEMGIDAEGRLFFTMTLVRGRTLHEILRLVRERREGWTQTRALQVFIRICDTLAYAHSKGVIHRDLKPSNVMVGAFGEVLVMDWGVAKILRPAPGSDPLTVAGPPPVDTPEVEEPDPLTNRGDVLGTPEYMPAEQATGRLDLLDRRADVYSVGAMLYELLAGVPPYHDASTPRTPIRILQAVARGGPVPVESHVPGVAPELAAICRRAMDRDLAARYQTAEELANDLHRFLDGRVVLAHSRGPFVELRAWIRRNRGLAGTVAGSLLLLASGGFLYGVDQRKAANVIAGERDAARAAELKEREERRRAVGLRLAAQAAAEVAKSPALALQDLAVEAADRAPGAEATDALYAALARSQERRRLVGHDGYLVGGTWSPDGTRLLTWEDGACAVLWDAESGALLHRLLCEHGRILHAAFAPDGARVATAGSDGTIRLWDAATGKALKVLPGHEGQVAVVAFSPDGRVLASGGDDRTVRLWSASGGEEIRVLKGHEGPVRDLAFSPEGDRVASIAGDATCRVWDRASGELLFRVVTREGEPDLAPFPAVTSYRKPYEDQVMFAAGGRSLVTSADHLKIHALEPGGPRLLVDRDQAFRAAVSGDGRRVAALVWLGKAKFAFQRWDAADGTAGAPVPVRDRCYGLSLDARGKRLVAAFEGFDAEVWDLDEGRLVSVLRGHRYPINTTCWAPDDARVLTCSSDMSGRIWAAEPPDAVRIPAGCDTDWMSADGSRILHPDGDSGAASVPVSILDTATGLPVARITVPGPYDGLSWLPDGRHLRTTGSAGTRVLDAATGKATVSVPPLPDAYSNSPTSATPDYSRVLYYRKKGPLAIYDVASGRWLDGPTGAGHFIPFLSPDGKRLLTEEGGWRTATLWGLDPLRSIRVFTNHGGYALQGAWSPDGKLVASAAVDGVVHLIDPDTGVEGPSAGPVPLKENYPILGNGHRWLIVRSANTSEILLFDTQTGERLATIREQEDTGGIHAVRFVEGRDAFSTVTGDGGLLHLWPFDPLRVARTRLPIELEPEVVRKFQLLPEEALDAYQEGWLRRHSTAKRYIDRALVLLQRGAIERSSEWLEATRAIRPDYPEIDWTEACIRARRAGALPAGSERDREVEKALASLARTVEKGSEIRERASKERARNEKNLASLRDDPRFKALVGE